MPRCEVCFRHCQLNEGQTGFCGVRRNRNGVIWPDSYGRITSMALDPIEKKPLQRFYPRSRILSIGSYGCNLRCPFCQNHEISWSREAYENADQWETIAPEELLRIALDLQKRGNIGIAFTYNEPLIAYEFVRDTAKLFHEAGLKTVLVSNGMTDLSVLHEISPYIDAMNIDLKGFTDRYYEQVLQGNRQQVLDFISEAVKTCHVELTTLIVPGENDSEKEMHQLSQWIAERKDASDNTVGQEIPLHISRFFPCFHMTDRKATDVSLVYHLADIAREHLNYVYTGNC